MRCKNYNKSPHNEALRYVFYSCMNVTEKRYFALLKTNVEIKDYE